MSTVHGHHYSSRLKGTAPVRGMGTGAVEHVFTGVALVKPTENAPQCFIYIEEAHPTTPGRYLKCACENNYLRRIAWNDQALENALFSKLF